MMEVMKKVFFTLILLTTTIAAKAQGNYHDALISYYKVSTSALSGIEEKMSEVLKMLSDALITDYKGMTSEQLVNKYMKEKFMADMVDNCMMPVVKKYVTIAEINELTAALSTQAGKTYQGHYMQVNNNERMEKLGGEVAQTIIDGNTPKPVTVKSGIPQSYVNLYSQFYDLSWAQSMIGQMGSLSGDKQDSPEVQKIIKYMENNMRNITLNNSYGIITTDDMKFGIKLFKKEAYKHMMKATTEILQDPQSLGMGIVMAYMSWLKEQGVTSKSD